MTNVFAKLKPKRRWVQISLRTVLVLVTLVCVGLSLWVVPLERKRRAVAAIEALGGNIHYVDHLGLRGNQVTQVGLVKLRQALPKGCRIDGP